MRSCKDCQNGGSFVMCKDHGEFVAYTKCRIHPLKVKSITAEQCNAYREILYSEKPIILEPTKVFNEDSEEYKEAMNEIAHDTDVLHAKAEAWDELFAYANMNYDRVKDTKNEFKSVMTWYQLADLMSSVIDKIRREKE